MEASVPLSRFRAQIWAQGNLFCAPSHTLPDEHFVPGWRFDKGVVWPGVYIGVGEGPTNTFALLAGIFACRLVAPTWVAACKSAA